MKKILTSAFLTVLMLTSVQCTKTSHGVVKEQYVHQYGVTLNKSDWMNRGGNGQIISTLKNGVLVTKNYRGGVLEGKTTYTFPHSLTVAKVKEYRDGNLVMVTDNYTAGTPLRCQEFLDENAVKLTSWYPSGTPKSIETFNGGLLVSGEYFDRENKKDSAVKDMNGNRIVRDEYGEMISEDVIEEGELVVSKTFYHSGTPKSITEFNDGMIDGKRQTFLPNGEPLAVENWIEGRQDGVTVVFKDGAKFAEVPYVNGVKHGVEKRFKQEDFVAEKITWENGSRTGPTYYYVDGNKEVEWYLEGKKVSKLTYEERHR
ncbi:MAG: toxin-antitoxin system YwqK family antitoxin [Chlamydiota bacterium]